MAKKQTEKTTRAKAEKDEQIVLSSDQQKALKLVEKSAKVRADVEEAVGLAIAKAVRKCMKDHGIALSASEANDLAAIWFGD